MPRPLLSRRRLLRLATVLALAAGSTLDRPVAAIKSTEYCPNPEERRVLELLNDLRARETARRAALTPPLPALAPLQMSATLGAAARHHATDMAERQYFDHDTPEGVSFWQRAAAHGYPSGAAAENIAAGYASADSVMRGWEASSGHLANMLGPYTTVGIGFDRRLWVQVFGRQVDAAPACGEPQPTATPEPQPTATPEPQPTPKPPGNRKKKRRRRRRQQERRPPGQRGRGGAALQRSRPAKRR
jgi:uncharacterized protein YkwD